MARFTFASRRFGGIGPRGCRSHRRPRKECRHSAAQCFFRNWPNQRKRILPQSPSCQNYLQRRAGSFRSDIHCVGDNHQILMMAGEECESTTTGEYSFLTSLASFVHAKELGPDDRPKPGKAYLEGISRQKQVSLAFFPLDFRTNRK